MERNDEAELIARCRAGQPSAWQQLFDFHYAPTGRFIFQISADFQPEDVQEICQDVFLTVIRNLSALRAESQIQTWIFRIALSRAHDFLARRNALKRGGGQTVVPLEARDVEDQPPIDPPTPSPGPDRVLMTSETMAEIRQSLDQLGDPCREVLELRYFGGLSCDEIAGALHLNPKTVRSRLSKCRARLETILRPLLQARPAGVAFR